MNDDRAARLARLADIAEVLERAPELYEERLAIFQSLVADGVPHAEIAEAARVTPKAVGFALGKARRGATARAVG